MENNNSVCYVARINEIKPIEGADNIQLATIGGWNCIVKKGAHKVGELVVCTNFRCDEGTEKVRSAGCIS